MEPDTMQRLPRLASLAAAASAVLMIVLLPSPQAVAEPQPGQLQLTVSGIKEVKGALMIAVYDQAGYGPDKAIAQTMAPVTGESVSVTIPLPAGRYGIKLFQDVDGDGKMATNPFGMPIEPYAFSNNAPAQFGPAKWDAAAFDVAAGGATHAIKFN
jgi:uncharacterized protein (DUF2141 family)